MNPAILLTVITVGISIWGFYDQALINKLILSPYLVMHKKQWYRVVTHAFIHADWMHLLFNMIALWSFGVAIVYYFSQITAMPNTHFYILYFGAILFSSLPDLLKKKNDMSFLSLGASGGVSAVIFSSIFFNPWNMLYVFFVPCPGIVFGIIYLIYSSYMGKRGGGHINHEAHFYGSIFGLLYPIFINPSSFNSFIQSLMHPPFF